ncbi:acyltransferase domain-containing protein [Streptomyces sp. ISL-111]|uniref:acyltransferase domain-containing protein n=1 Tax=Streptomyces sp. ISL-111 TaxID=2819175 RepID=UPI001BED0CAF|nr:acyltransferase domain-containing protein [Streptomyces sp. ISL-111]MBT2377334.1 acyltransferase domain-containing protein [Streptomyces sp. ISL-111]
MRAGPAPHTAALGRPPLRRPVHLFPGQGDFSVSALVASVHAVPGLRTAVREVFEQVDTVAAERGLPELGPRLLGPHPPSGRDLAHATTGTAQLVLFGASVAIHRALSTVYGAPSAAVGVSFGEIAALTAAGVFAVEDGARAAHDLAVALTFCPGGLTALACSERAAHVLLEEAGATEAVVAVVNDERSVVVAGPVAALALVEKAAADRRTAAVRLRLPFSSHHPALGHAAEAFATAVRAYPCHDFRFPVHSAVAGRRYGPADDLAARLADCLVRPAAVPPVLNQVLAYRPGALFEAGTGSALASSARTVLTAALVPAPPVHAPLAEPGFPW